MKEVNWLFDLSLVIRALVNIKLIKPRTIGELCINSSSGFLRRSEKKRKFYPYLVEFSLQKYQFHDKIILATKNEKVITNLKGSLAEVKMPGCLQPETDSRIILHVWDCI